jgi:hypothetical protein
LCSLFKVATTVSSAALAISTLVWFSSVQPRHYSEVSRSHGKQAAAPSLTGAGVASLYFWQDPQPCNVPLINVWKSASYSAGVTSALIIVAANTMGKDRFPESLLLPVLVATWLGVIFGEEWGGQAWLGGRWADDG